jgi:ComF family protein
MVNIWPFFAQLSGAACPVCGLPGDGLCIGCLDTLPRNHHPCGVCALPLPPEAPPGTLCAECQLQRPSFDEVLAPLLYKTPVDELIARFKYHHGLPVGRMLSEILLRAAGERSDRPELLLPVPIQASRLRERGFNQAGEITCHLAHGLGLKWSTTLLARVRDTGPQRSLGRRRRRRNLRGAFTCLGGIPRHVALVDDVMTTGATAEALSRVLRQAGAGRIEVWTIARTPRGDA